MVRYIQIVHTLVVVVVGCWGLGVRVGFGRRIEHTDIRSIFRYFEFITYLLQNLFTFNFQLSIPNPNPYSNMDKCH